MTETAVSPPPATASGLYVTIADVMAWTPCYSQAKITALYAGRERLTALDILDLDIPAKDRFWAATRISMAASPPTALISSRSRSARASCRSHSSSLKSAPSVRNSARPRSMRA